MPLGKVTAGLMERTGSRQWVYDYCHLEAVCQARISTIPTALVL